jgi:zinc protease
MLDRMKIVVFLLIAVFSMEPCFPQYRNPGKRIEKVRRAPFLAEAAAYEETPYVTKIVFKNGMKVLVNEFHAQPLISIQSYINGGISDESAQNQGIASLLAAMIGRGDINKKSGTLRQKIHALGGTFDIRTDIDQTQFEIVTPSAQWKQALNIHIDALLHPGLERDSIKLEAALMMAEAKSYQEDPDIILDETLLETAFNQPRFSKYGVLSGNSLAMITPESLAKFHKIRYVPSEIMMVISGDIRSGEVLDELVKNFNAAENHPPSMIKTEMDSAQKELKYRLLYGDVPNPRLVFGFHTSSDKSQDFQAVEVLQAILVQGEGSIFNTRLRDQKRIMISASGSLRSFQNSGYFSIEIETEPVNIDKCEIALLTEIELIKREGPSEADLKRAIAQLERIYWAKMETVSDRAKMLAHYQSGGDWKQMQHYVSDLYKVKAVDVQKAAERYLKLNHGTLIEFLPNTIKDRAMTSDSINKTLEGLLAPSTDQEQQERIKEIVLDLKIPEPSTAFKSSEIQYPFQIASILRGPNIFIREEHSSPLLNVGIFFPGGKAKETPENTGITELMLQLMLRGNPEKQGSRLQRQLEIYGGKIQPAVMDDYFGFYFSIFSTNFEPGFALLQDILKNPNFDAAELERLKKLQVAKVLYLKSSPQFLQQKVRAALFNGFSYAMDGSGTEISINKINLDAVKIWYNDAVRNRKPTVVIIGDTKGTSLASYFVRQFSGSRMLESKTEEDYAPALGKNVQLEQNLNLSGSCIMQAFQAPPKGDEDTFTAMVLQHYLGENGRFTQEVRDRQGLAYRISLDYEPRLRGGSLNIIARGHFQKEEDVLKAIRGEIRHLIEDPMSSFDFQSAVTSVEGLSMVKNQSRIHTIADLAEYVFAGKTLEDYQGLWDNVRRVKEEDLKELAHRLFKADGSVLLRVHGVR